MQTLSIGKKKRVYAIAFAPSGEELTAVCGDGFLRTWDLTAGKIVRAIPIAETSSGYDVTYIDAEHIVFAGSDLLLYTPGTGAWLVISAGAPWGRRIKGSPDGTFLAEVDQSRSTDWVSGLGLLVHRTGDWELLPAMESAGLTTGGVAFSRDGKFLATGHIERVGLQTRRLGMLPGFQFEINEYDYLVHVREMPDGRVVRSLDGWQQAVTNLAFSPDGRFLAGTAGPRLRVWDLESDREVAIHKRGPKHFQGLSFTHDGRFLATVSNDQTVRVWDTGAWKECRTFTWEIGRLLNIVFAPDGLRAAAGSDKGQIVIWDVE